MSIIEDDLSNLPVGLYAWSKPLPEESAHGMLLRLTTLNGYANADRTAHAIGINRSLLAHGDRDELGKFAAGVKRDLSDILRDSPVRDEEGQLTVRGVPLTKFMHTVGIRRACPGCLAESEHHRFWWDILPVTSCPRHRLLLVDRCGCGEDSNLDWRGSGLLSCRQCGTSTPEMLPRQDASADVLRSDSYLLSRLGVVEAPSVPVLDGLSLWDALDTLERIGAADVGYRVEWQSTKTTGIPLGELQGRGFAVLADGRLPEVLTKVFDGFVSSGGDPVEGFTACYGWLYHWFNHKGGQRFSPALAETFLLHGAERFPITPKSGLGLGLLPKPARRKLSLKAAAARCGVSVMTMRHVGQVLGLVRDEKRSGLHVSFAVEDVERLAADLKGALCLQEVQRLLGVGYKVGHRMMEAGLLVPVVAGGQQHKHLYIFRGTDVDALLGRLAGRAKAVAGAGDLVPVAEVAKGRASTVVDCLRSILDGRLEVRARLKGAVGLAALLIDPADLLDPAKRPVSVEGVPLAAAARRMRLSSRGLALAIGHGLLPGVQAGAKHVPESVVDGFAARYLMLSEVREHVPGYYPTLKDMMQRMGFEPDPSLAKCLQVGYPRKAAAAFLADLASGKMTTAVPEDARTVVIAAATRVLTAAKVPIPSKDILAKLRKDIRIGPSDQDQFFYATMWEEKQDFVFVVGAGWWLRQRPYLGRIFDVDAGQASHHDVVADTILDMLRVASAPMSHEDIVAALRKRKIDPPAADMAKYLRRFAVKHVHEVARLTGLGYWDRARLYAPALYDPKTCPTGIQSAFERVGAWIIRHLKERGAPAEHDELTEMLRKQHVVVWSRNMRSYINLAAKALPDDIVYLRDHGYWLKRRPWKKKYAGEAKAGSLTFFRGWDAFSPNFADVTVWKNRTCHKG